MPTIAHLSDLHLGHSLGYFLAAQAIRKAIDDVHADQVIVTGDITDRGRDREYALFEEVFGSLRAEGRLIVVPGNHDRISDDAGRHMMDGERVVGVHEPGLFVIRVNSTCWFNRFLIAGQGRIDQPILEEVDRQLAQAAPDDFVVLTVHHHLLPLPEDLFAERVASWLYLPFADELRFGRRLLERLQGRCDLVLHGHRHVPVEIIRAGHRSLHIYNAGASTILRKFRLFSYEVGKLVGEPKWIDV